MNKNIFDDHERNNKEAGQFHDQRDHIRTNWEQNDNNEEFDFEKCHGIAIFVAYLFSYICIYVVQNKYTRITKIYNLKKE